MDYDYQNTDDLLIDLIINGVAYLKVQERLLDQGQGLTLAKAIKLRRLRHSLNLFVVIRTMC